jgi:hypothetical protein
MGVVEKRIAFVPTESKEGKLMYETRTVAIKKDEEEKKERSKNGDFGRRHIKVQTHNR